MKHCDVIWMGTGQAAGTILPRVSAAGKTVARIEGSTILGVGGDEVMPWILDDLEPLT